MKRRRFIRALGGAAGSLLVPECLAGVEDTASTERARIGSGGDPETLPGEGGEERLRLVVLHTNDTHSRMDPFPMDGGRFQGLGGAARRATLIRRIRRENDHVLLLDAGDVFQGTPYFNFFRGEIEFRAMSEMGYDVATLGNHDFDNGVDGLVEMLPHADFPFVSANYDVSASSLAPRVDPWVIRDVGGIRVGIFGLGIAFEGLVLAHLHQGVRYTDPYAAARRAVSHLRARGCALVICLSHLGYRYRGNQPSDTRLAQKVQGIDLILGGHTHTFMDEPDIHTGPDGRVTLVNQVGWAGMRLGRIDVRVASAERGPGARSPRGRRGGTGAPPGFSWRSYQVDPTLD